jgi:hypothetical protein
VAVPVLVDVDDAVEGAVLVRALERHGLIADLLPAGEGWHVETSLTRKDAHVVPGSLGLALVRCGAAELGIAAANAAGVARPPDGDATALVAALGAEDRAGQALRLRLRVLLLGAVCFELDRRRDQLRLDAASAADLARQAADRAYTTVLMGLGDYHGESRFTTWAAKFAIHHAAVAARRTGGEPAVPANGRQGSS